MAWHVLVNLEQQTTALLRVVLKIGSDGMFCASLRATDDVFAEMRGDKSGSARNCPNLNDVISLTKSASHTALACIALQLASVLATYVLR